MNQTQLAAQSHFYCASRKARLVFLRHISFSAYKREMTPVALSDQLILIQLKYKENSKKKKIERVTMFFYQRFIVT